MTRLLIIEDDPHIGALLERGLRNEGFDVTLVTTGESGIGTDGGLGAGSDGTVPKELAGERAFPKSAADPPIMRESVARRCRR